MNDFVNVSVLSVPLTKSMAVNCCAMNLVSSSRMDEVLLTDF